MRACWQAHLDTDRLTGRRGSPYMALTELWNTSPDQLRDKHVQQVIAFAGSGKLLDDGEASAEFRDFLSVIPSASLSRYADDCLKTAFEDSGLALQDSVNEIGRRLGFTVEHGRYRGIAGGIGFDGIWHSDDGKSIVIEVKTTDAYRIDLNKVAGYRRMLIQNDRLRPDDSSVSYTHLTLPANTEVYIS